MKKQFGYLFALALFFGACFSPNLVGMQLRLPKKRHRPRPYEISYSNKKNDLRYILSPTSPVSPTSEAPCSAENVTANCKFSENLQTSKQINKILNKLALLSFDDSADRTLLHKQLTAAYEKFSIASD